MKTRLVIIIGIISLVGIIAVFTMLDMYHGQSGEKLIVESTYLSSDKPLQRVLDHCEYQRKFAAEEIPERNADGSYNVIDLPGLSFQNGTHYIDNNICQWQKITKFPNTDIECIPYIDKWIGGEDIRNGTHKYDYDSCQWIRMVSFGTTAYPLPDNLKNDFTGRYFDDDHPNCYSDKIDPVYGVIVANETHTFNHETCLWELGLEERHQNSVHPILTEEQIDDQIDIVFGNARKSWTVYPGGVGYILPENSTLTRIYKDSGFGMPTLDLEAMLNDQIFVDKCESNGGIWNYTYRDCEGIWEICKDIGGIQINRDITKPCTSGVCLDGTVYRISCVFEYEN